MGIFFDPIADDLDATLIRVVQLYDSPAQQFESEDVATKRDGGGCLSGARWTVEEDSGLVLAARTVDNRFLQDGDNVHVMGDVFILTRAILFSPQTT